MSDYRIGDRVIVDVDYLVHGSYDLDGIVWAVHADAPHWQVLVVFPHWSESPVRGGGLVHTPHEGTYWLWCSFEQLEPAPWLEAA